MIKNLKNKKKKRAFTLIELIIVIAIIAILSAIAIPKFGEIRSNAALKTDIANAKTIANAATILLTEEKLKDLTESKPVYVDSDSTESNDIETYLQNAPTPKTSGYVQYMVELDGSSVTVYMVKTKKTETGKYELFPNIEATAP